MVVEDQLFGELLGLVGTLARRVPVDELDLDLLSVRPLDGVAVERPIGLDWLLELAAPGREGAGVGGDEPDLDDIAGGSRDGPKQQRSANDGPKQSPHR